MTVSAEDRARRIKIILFDVDGVLTDGTIWVLPIPVAQPDGTVNSRVVEAKGFSAHDGAGMTLARLGGMKVGIITKRISETVAIRARDLKLEFVYQGQAFKMKGVREIAQQAGVTLDALRHAEPRRLWRRARCH
jgi:3-deoxy-D-manno-octulosonate 8-phosphate phosphatase (KDO 8-P phosphatase)